MKSFIRVVLVLPSMLAGGLIAAVAATIFNLPIIFIQWLDDRMGGWSIGALLLGKAGGARVTDGLCAFFSGIFIVFLALAFALNMFPFKRYRRFAAYCLFALLFLNFASPYQIEIYGSRFVYGAKLLGVLVGFIGLLNTLKRSETAGLFTWVDHRFGDESPNNG